MIRDPFLTDDEHDERAERDRLEAESLESVKRDCERIAAQWGCIVECRAFPGAGRQVRGLVVTTAESHAIVMCALERPSEEVALTGAVLGVYVKGYNIDDDMNAWGALWAWLAMLERRTAGQRFTVVARPQEGSELQRRLYGEEFVDLVFTKEIAGGTDPSAA